MLLLKNRSDVMKKPKFLRQEWYRFKNKKKWLKWRRPRGRHSKLRRHVKGKGFLPNPGYGKANRGLHPCGLREVLVHTVSELKGLDPKQVAVRIAKSVGMKKRIEIQKKAQELKLKILNPKEVKK